MKKFKRDYENRKCCWHYSARNRYARLGMRTILLQNPDCACSGGFLRGPVPNFPVAPDQFSLLARIRSTYQAGLNQICAAVTEAIQSRKSPQRPWTPSLEPWDFAPFLLEKRNHFTGRKWLFRDLDEWRSKEAPPALLITGEPGIGKSAIVAALVDDNPEGQVLAYQCCRADTPVNVQSGLPRGSLA
jgi:hypothetical protein